ncbi:MAG: UMP kinase [Planctomycetota bacterium]
MTKTDATDPGKNGGTNGGNTMQNPDNPGRPRRVLLKISGESLCEPGGFGVDHDPLEFIGHEIADACDAGGQIAIVVGGGNIIRGATLAERGDISRAAADHMGMLGTMINAVALNEKLRRLGLDSTAMSAVGVRGVVDVFNRARALHHIESRGPLVLGGGTGNPFFTTDTCASLRAAELDCAEVLKATKVDGVYDSDPAKNPAAKRFNTLTLSQAVERGLGVMDVAALAMCRDAGVAVRVFRFAEKGNIARVVRGEPIGTLVTPG